MPQTLVLEPIGVVHSPLREKRQAPRQPAQARGVAGSIELLARPQLEHALCDLQTWSHIWVLFWFHRSVGWRPKVEPPRSRDKRGVFATRSPYRPNPIGLSVLALTGVSGRVLHVQDLDILDQTPVLDIKPYVAYTDAVPEASAGWLAAQARSCADVGPRYDVVWQPPAHAHLAWLEPRLGFDLREAVERVLEAGPTPHPYRRIKRGPDYSTLAVKDFRVRFTVDGRSVHVHAIGSGYRASVLADPGAASTTETPLAVHRAFLTRFFATPA